MRQLSALAAADPLITVLGDRSEFGDYAVQVFFIGVGAVVASCLPWIFEHFGVGNVGTADEPIPDTVRYAFDVGAAVLVIALLWTVFTTRE